LNILFLRREEPGSVVTQGGDIDNRLKTLFDALRIPLTAGELPTGFAPGPDEKPFHCLLESDALITQVGVVTDRLLTLGDQSHVSLVIHAIVKPTIGTHENIALTG
jgi:hypothetical protein